MNIQVGYETFNDKPSRQEKKREMPRYCRSCGSPMTRSEFDNRYECNDCKLNTTDPYAREKYGDEDDE